MLRWSLVFAFVVLSTVVARADAPCVCAPQRQLLPAPGARDVPRNTKAWVLGRVFGMAQLDGGEEASVRPGRMSFLDDTHATRMFELGELAAGRPYRFYISGYGPSTQFTTGAVDDYVPPARPELHALSIAASDPAAGAEPVVDIQLDAGFDPDTVLLYFTFNVDEPNQRLAIRHRSRSVVTTLEGWRTLGRPACGTALAFAPGDRIVVTIQAIDLAGNTSAPMIREVTVDRAPGLAGCAVPGANGTNEPAHPTYRHPCGGSGVYLLVSLGICAIIAGCVACMLGYLMMHFRRARQARLAMPESVSLLVAERLARGVQRRGGVLAAVGIAGVPLLMVTNIGPLAIVSTIVGCIGLRGFVLARSVLHLIESATRVDAPAGASATASIARSGAAPAGRALAPVAAEIVGLTVVVRSVTDEASVEVSPGALAAARRHAVPTSIARRS